MATRVSGPYGLSTTVCRAGGVVMAVVRRLLISAGRRLIGWSSVAHRYWTAYARQGRQAAARAVSAAGVDGQAELLRPARRMPRSVGQEGVGVAEGAHRDDLDRPGAEAGQGERAGRGPASQSLSTPRCERAVGECADQGGEGGAAGAGHGQGLGVEAGQRLGGREEVGEAALGVVDRLAVRGDQPGRVGAGRGRGDLLAEHRPYGELRRVDGARHPAARRLVDQRREQRVGAQLVVDGDRVGVQVEHPAAAADRDGQVAQVGEGEPAGDVVGLRGEGDDAVPVREAQGAPVRAVAPLLHAGYGGRGEVAEEVVGVERGAERQPQAISARGCGGVPGRLRAARARSSLGDEREDLADGVVEGADRGEARPRRRSPPSAARSSR